MKLPLLIVFFAIVAAACNSERSKTLPYYNSPNFTPVWLTSDKDIAVAHTIPAFHLTDQDGEAVTRSTVKGKIYAANFFFTACGSVCPRMMDNLKKVDAAFRNDPDVFILSHSVTPGSDSVAKLNLYAMTNDIDHKKWLLLTGNKDSIYTLARKAYYADEQQGFYKGTNDFLHTENVVLVDKHGHIRGVYNGTLPLEMDHLIEHIRLLEKEE